MSTQATKNLEKRAIEDATINQLFGVLSEEFGYDYTEWLDEILALQDKWQKQGFVEVYSSDKYKEYGRVKDSSLKHGASPWYIGIYHARLMDNGDNDPLVIVKFHETETGEIVDMKLMLDHPEIFGKDAREKSDPARMKEIRQQIDEFIQKADAKLVEKE
ncbi:TPA: hypothetical protein ACX6PH_000424 [Photobacterium damselae]